MTARLLDNENDGKRRNPFWNRGSTVFLSYFACAFIFVGAVSSESQASTVGTKKFSPMIVKAKAARKNSAPPSQSGQPKALIVPPPEFLDACFMAPYLGQPRPQGVKAAKFVSTLNPKLTWEANESGRYIIRQETYDDVSKTRNSNAYVLWFLSPEQTQVASAIGIAGMKCGPSGVVLTRVITNGRELSEDEVYYFAASMSQGR